MARTSASARPLTDHEEIRRWAEERGATPACVRGTGDSNDTGMIRLDFPGYSGAGSLEEISWDDWFEKFDESNLALIVQDETASGDTSNFNKLVSRDTAETGRSSRRNSRSTGTSRGSHRSTQARSNNKASHTSKARSAGRASSAQRSSAQSSSAQGRSAQGRSAAGSKQRTSSKTSANSRRSGRTSNQSSRSQNQNQNKKKSASRASSTAGRRSATRRRAA
jgi:hypothetical protein